MIVQPNFLEHWKTRLLQSELGDDPLAPLYVLRIWGHCQEQKRHRFSDLSAPALSAICRFKGAPEQLWLAMQTSGFILLKNTTVEVHQWDKYNAGLITSWSNGKRGGRPRKPTGIPQVTHGQPTLNLNVTDREDKIEKIDKNTFSAPAAPERERNPLFDALASITGAKPEELTKDAARACGVALAQIRKVAPSLDPPEIHRRAENYRRHFSGASITPSALAKHWATCANEPVNEQRDKTRATWA